MVVFVTVLAGIVTLMMHGLVARHVFTLVPAILHKVDPFTASVVLGVVSENGKNRTLSRLQRS